MIIASEKIYTLSDLKNWPTNITSLAVIGHPINHSISPFMHNAALQAMSISNPDFKSWKYFKWDIHPKDLNEALQVMHQKHFKGINLTLPHKIDAMDYITEIDPLAENVKAVNTLLWMPKGYKGFNTDCYGIQKTMTEDLKVSFQDTHFIILGAGGAARAAAVTCIHQNCKALWIGNRNLVKLKSLIEDLLALQKRKLENADTASKNSIPLYGFDIHKPPFKTPCFNPLAPLFANSSKTIDSPLVKSSICSLTIPPFPEHGVLIQSTSLGLQANDELPLKLDFLNRSIKVFDMIYNPPKTRLLMRAEQLNSDHINGLPMLIGQGARALEIWTNSKVPYSIMAEAAQRAVSNLLYN